MRTTYDVLEWAKTNNKTGLLLLLDFEKAFDSISFSYIKKVLHFFNFSENLINWVSLLLYNFRQGDPIASSIFILCIEILAIKLRTSEQVEPFKIGTVDILLSLYADDMSVFLEPDERNLLAVLNILNDFF